ncbi:Uncharacterised protein [uncultured archaeon]|nr:Uncharacterised protein [uncultured archaeon]
MERNKREILKKWTGWALVILSFAFYGALLLVPFLSLSPGNKIILSSTLVVLGEASFWIAVLILGRQVISRYRSFPWRSKIAELFKSSERKP